MPDDEREPAYVPPVAPQESLAPLLGSDEATIGLDELRRAFGAAGQQDDDAAHFRGWAA